MSTEEFCKAIGPHILAIAADHSATLDHLAGLLTLTPDVLGQKIEIGRFTIDEFETIAAHLDIPLTELVDV